MKGGGYLKIYCDGCGATWEVYEQAERARQCPCCGLKIPLDVWGAILAADAAADEARLALAQSSAEVHTGRFMVSFIDRSIYPKKMKDG